MSIELIATVAAGVVLSKHGSTLIEKASEAVGGLCAPWQSERVRKGEAKGEAPARSFNQVESGYGEMICGTPC